MALTDRGQSRLARFWRATEGSAGLEFVVTLPLLVGVLVISAEFGKAMLTREALDSATSAAARLLALSPSRDVITDAEGNATGLALYDHFVAEAEALIAERLGAEPDQVGLGLAVETVEDGSSFREPYHVITLSATVDLPMPLLGLLDLARISGTDPRPPGSLRMTAIATTRWLGPVAPGQLACRPPFVLDGCSSGDGS